MTIKGLGIPVVDYTESVLPSCDIEVLKRMVGDPEKKRFINSISKEFLNILINRFLSFSFLD